MSAQGLGLTNEEAKAVLCESCLYRAQHHYGTPLCNECRAALDAYIQALGAANYRRVTGKSALDDVPRRTK